ncbi:hypothetical protein KQH81_07035 [Clostridium cadaveris]|uniref:Uncharacterized protein n=1 Tax=Clostridium cadaveris TaxID=1529 RepID=A0A316M1L0_9CLOT|nr:hypothetical protein [Clostridium cadaveris]PWL52074.1 MAG: hypothetical protein DBY38_12195 [Clostridium cadaveris]UFH65063.1 hypothetical protein KQH81_00355 [Clostridium cadaveris]UFH66267.1 hypothetical protein KQH81_07035 [Clostridium cadaveris]
MSKKSELINTIKAYKEKQEALSNKILELNNNKELTPIGVEQRINNLIEPFEAVAQNVHDKAIGILDSAIKALEDRWRANTTGKLLDSSYQIGLSNIIKIIEAGAITSKEDFINIIDVYKDDYNALSIIRELLANNGNALELLMLIPKDNREYNKKILNDLRNNIENYINPFNIKASISMPLDSMIQFIDTRLRDDFSVIPWEEVRDL